MFEFKRYLPITKIDEEKRMVYGWASTPDLDSDGEIVSLKAIEQALPEYLKFPTIREMHQAKAAGTTKNAEVVNGKGKKGLYIGAKIVTDDAWKLVKEGVYKGFSIGGNILKKVGNVIEGLELIEVSLVDVPANKAATIELWKAHKGGGEEDMKKNANTVYSLTSLMGHTQDVISYFDYLGKDSVVKKLAKILESLKGFIATEAAEPETSDDAGSGIMLANTLEQRANAILKIDVGDDPMAQALRKEVSEVMLKKAKELKKQADEAAEEGEAKADEIEAKQEEAVEEAGAESEEAAKDSETETAEADAKADAEEEDGEEESEEEEESKESSALPDFKKIEKTVARLDKLSKTEKVDNSKLELAKSVNALAGGLAKVADVIEKLEERIANLEKTPAALKSKSTAVFRSGAEEQELKMDKAAKDATSKELEAKKARMAELDGLFEKMGANEFAKAGHSKEASTLQDEIAELEFKLGSR